MGVDIEQWRARIGTFAPRSRPRRPTRAYSVYDPTGSFDTLAVKAVHLILFTALLLCLVRAVLVTSLASSLYSAMTGSDLVRQPGFDTAAMPSSTSAVYDYDRSKLLLLASDIETNPGPLEREDLLAFGDTMMEKIEAMLTRESQNIRRDLAELSTKVSRVEMEIQEIRDSVQAQAEDIENLESCHYELENKVKELSEKVEEQERRGRRDNVLLFGVPEAEDNTGARENCEEKFVQVANDVLPEHLHVNDLTRAHRVGKRQPGRTRPLIACLRRTSDKIAILQKRRELKAKGIGVSSDLTVKQREEIRRAQEEGYFAFFRGGVLHREERRERRDAPPDRDRPLTRSASRAASSSGSATRR